VTGQVPFQAGNLTAVAYDGIGAVVAVDSVLTAGPPVALQLSVEDNNGRPYADALSLNFHSIPLFHAFGVQCSVVYLHI
jgi:hypothetical protein